MFMVLAVMKTVDISSPFGQRTVPLCTADGMVGAAPIFRDHASALAWADGDESMIVEINNKFVQLFTE
jgi:hypothetical protein